jgi:shikimate dehydrogenase
VTLVNRDAEAGRRAAERLGLPFTPLREFDPRRYAVLVNATPVRNAAPFPAERTDPAVVIFDLTYGPRESALIAAARAAGRRAIDGRAVTLAELPRQFHEMTGRTIPPGIVRAAFREFGLGAYPSVAAGPRPAQAARFPIPDE